VNAGPWYVIWAASGAADARRSAEVRKRMRRNRETGEKKNDAVQAVKAGAAVPELLDGALDYRAKLSISSGTPPPKQGQHFARRGRRGFAEDSDCIRALRVSFAFSA
jgi:hypothetical protein